LVEPLKKRVAFLHLIRSAYDLKNVTIIQDRVENIDIKDINLITSRAVTKVDELINLSKHLITKETELLLYKGSNLQNELKELEGLDDYDIIRNQKRRYIYLRNVI
jgi:16S rRNA (guanine527-N7)-methyltransferase